MTTKEEIIERLDELNEDQQREILRTIETLKSRPKGEPGWRAIQHAREIGFSSEDLAEMAAAIEEACETIDPDPDVNFND